MRLHCCQRRTRNIGVQRLTAAVTCCASSARHLVSRSLPLARSCTSARTHQTVSCADRTATETCKHVTLSPANAGMKAINIETLFDIIVPVIAAEIS